MNPPEIVAIDGPAASGKSTIANILAQRWGYLYFDTGVMYRAITWIALDSGVSVDDEQAVTELARTVDIDVRSPSVDDGRDYDVLADGEDVTWEIRQPEVDKNVSRVAAYPGVREALTAEQRRIGLRGNVIMVGRDIGTVVLPEADLKIYLDASVEERARRRYQQRLERGEDVTFEPILEGMKKRDEIDSTRKVAPLRAAEDALILDSDDMSIAEVVKEIEALARSQEDR